MDKAKYINPEQRKEILTRLKSAFIEFGEKRSELMGVLSKVEASVLSEEAAKRFTENTKAFNEKAEAVWDGFVKDHREGFLRAFPALNNFAVMFFYRQI